MKIIKVFSFSFKTKIKQLSFIIFTATVFLFLIASIPISALIYEQISSENKTSTEIEKVIVVNETGGKSDFSRFNTVSSLYTGIIYDYAPTIEQGKEMLSQNDLVLWIRENQKEYSIKVLYSTNGRISVADANSFGAFIAKNLDLLIYQQHGFSDKLPVSVETSEFFVQSNDVPLSHYVKMFRFFLPPLLAIMIYFIIFSKGQWVSTELNSDKTDNVWEILSASTHPFYLITGRIFVSVLIGAIQFLLWGAGIILGMKISSLSFEHCSHLFTVIKGVNIFYGILLFVIGLFFYASLSALCSTAFRKSNETSSTGIIFSLPILFSLLLKIAEALGVTKHNPLLTLFPPTSAFYLSSFYQNHSLIIILCSVVLSLSASLLMIKISAKYYNRK